MSSPYRIPSNAELMFSWIRSQIFQWDQDMYDGSVRRFETIRFLDAAFVLPILPNWDILLTRQEQPWRTQFISLPGGSFDFPEEDPRICAMRELREETGYKTDSLVDWMEFHWTSNVFTEVHYYIARDCVLVWDMMPDGGEKIELFTVSFDELIELSSDRRFHHHWNLLPIFYEARLDPVKKESLKKILYEM
jgi:ADP-ribose pyrophosphatase